MVAGDKVTGGPGEATAGDDRKMDNEPLGCVSTAARLLHRKRHELVEIL